MDYHHVGTISGKGSGPHQFRESLNGIGVDNSGLIYAVGDREVKVFDADGKLQRGWRTDKPGYCVAVDDAGVVYVGEAGQVEKFSTVGELLTTWRNRERLGVVTSIGFFGDYVFIADARDRCIRKYDGDANWLGNIGKDNKTKGFLIPNGYLDFAIDPDGIIHVANAGKFRVERYTIDGELLGHFGRFGTRRPQDFPGCCNPTNLSLAPQGNVVVTEKAGPRMKVYNADGTMLSLVGCDVFDANCKNMDVTVDAKGRIYVVDTVRLSILVFAPDGAEGTPAKVADSPGTAGVATP